jgi:hypothetical protein
VALSEPKLTSESRVVSVQKNPSTDSETRPLPDRRDWSVPLLLHGGDPCHQTAPITAGLPFPQGTVMDHSILVLLDESEKEVVLQTQILARWPDRSVQWLLLDFLAKTIAPEKTRWLLRERSDKPPIDSDSSLHVYETEKGIRVATGAATFHLSPTTFPPLQNVFVGGRDILDIGSRKAFAELLNWTTEAPIEQVVLEEKGPVRVTLRFEGKSSDESRRQWRARLCFFANSSVVKSVVSWDGRQESTPLWLDLARGAQVEENRLPWNFQPARVFAPLQWYASSGALAPSDLACDNTLDRLENILGEVAAGTYNQGVSMVQAGKSVGLFHSIKIWSAHVGARLLHLNRHLWSNVIWRS